MRAIFVMGCCDLRLFLKNKAAYVWLFVMPVLFIAFMGFAIRGPGDPANIRPTVVVDNRDTNYLSSIFIAELGSQGMKVVTLPSTEDVPQRIGIPANFTERVLSGQQAKVEFSKQDNAPPGPGAMVELRLIRALVAVNSDLLLAASAHGGEISQLAIEDARHAPSYVRLDARFAGRKPSPSGFSFSLPGNIVMYVMMNLLLFGAISITHQRQKGIIRRLACNPVTRGQMVAGKIFGLVLLGAVQVAVFLAAGRFLFGVNLGANLGTILVVLMIYAWVASSLGVLIGSVVQSEDKVLGLCLLASLSMAALGGCWWPLEIVPPALKTIAHCLPTGWALDALHQLISFGGGFHEVMRPMGVLAAFGLVGNVLAACFFRW